MGGSREINMVGVHGQMRGVHTSHAADKELILTCGRRGWRIHISRQQAVVVCVELEALLFRRGVPRQQLGAVVGTDLGTYEAAFVHSEIIVSLEVTGGPNPDLVVVGEAVARDRELVNIVVTGGVGAGRDCDAYGIRRNKYVLEEQPTMRNPVPLHNGVAGVVESAQRSGYARRPKGIAVEGSNQRVATLVEYRPRDVHIFDDLGVAHRHVSVGRRHKYGVAGEAVANSK